MYTGLEPRDLIADIKDKTRILQTPIAKQLTPFIHRYCGFVFKSYNSLLDKKENARKVSTGTCHPFERKIFITTTGKILPCERILHTYTFGKIDGNGVQLDFQHVADRYNAYYGKLTHQCNHCAASDMCSNCIFTLNLEQDKPTCNNQKREDKFNEQLKQSISLLEETPQFYPRIMRDYQSN